MGGSISGLIQRLGGLFLVGEGKAGYAQDYHARVGTVINAERFEFHQDFGIAPGATGRISPKVQLVPTFIDRNPQLSDLEERFKQYPHEARQGALLVVMPGCEEDLHQGFVLRCALKEFRDRYPSDVSWKYLSRLRWPEGARDIGYILRTVGDAMGLRSSAGQDEIERYIANYPRHLCFSHFVEGGDWASDNGALVRAWCEYFARGDLGIRAQRLIVAFLCVQLATERTSACHALEGFLNELRTRYSGPAGNILVTGPLSQVRKKDVDDWTGEAARYLEEEYLEGSLLEIPSRLFGDQQPRSRCFRDVYIEVRSELDRLLINERPRFTSERA